MDDTQWMYEIILVKDNCYIAKLIVLDDYDGYLSQWKHHKTSPKFATAEEAEFYAVKNWVR